MKFGPVAVAEAGGAILAHSAAVADGVVRKGTVLDKGALARLAKAGLDTVVVAMLDPDDVHEDAAADRLAACLAGEHIVADPPFTGRVNLYAAKAGILRIDKAAIDALNRRDPAMTVATLAEFAPVEAGRLVATVKIIPYAVAGDSLAAAVSALEAAAPAIAVAPFRPMTVGVVSTLLPSLKPTIVDKTLRVLGERLAPAGASIVAERRVPHEAEAVASAIATLDAVGVDLIVLFGASAVVDRRDVLPAGLAAAGGRVAHFGMPVDPGNLLLIGELGGKPVLGAPGCARSPAENGFDWVLSRMLAGLTVTADDITGMGVGGLLMEIVSRPQPREAGAAEARDAGPDARVAALVLAAGRSSRMGASNKLLATIDGVPLVRIAAEAALASQCSPVHVVTGHQADTVAAALDGLDVTIVDNPAYADGLSASLAAGIRSLDDDIDAVLVLLADMPRITPAILDRLVATFDPADDIEIVVPTFEGRRGNPVLWSRRFFAELLGLTGDIGARNLIARHAANVAEVEIGAAVALDVDTPEALTAAGGNPADGR